MRKYILLTVAVMLIFIFIGSVNVEAETLGKVEEYGGVGINEFTVEDGIDISATGIGCIGGLRKWFTRNLAYGAELEYFRIDWNNNQLNNGLIAFSHVMTYKLPLNNEVQDENWGYRYQFMRNSNFAIKILGGLGVYINGKNNSGVGAKVGTEFNFPVSDNAAIILKSSYRKIDIKLGEQLGDISGFGISGIFNFNF
ncbi:MAG: hypothetical protein ACQERJ_06060 [Bacillota bacterium]